MASVLTVCRCEKGSAGWCSRLRKSRGPHRVVGEAGDAAEARRLLAERRPDLVLVDLASFGGRATDVCRKLVVAGEGSGEPALVVAVAPRLDDVERSALLEAGASGCVLSTIDGESMAIALQAIAEVASPDRTGMHRNGRPSGAFGARFLGDASGARRPLR